MTSQPWDRQRDAETGELEPMLWFGRFTLYRKTGTERSMLGTVNKSRKAKNSQTNDYIPGSWRDAAEKWNWKARAEAYDLHEMERIETQFQADCDAWRVERFNFAVTARAKLDQLTAFPVVRQTKVDDGKAYIIEPLSAKELRSVISAYKDIDTLARITTKEPMPVTKVAPVTPDGKEEYGKDADRQRLALLTQLINSEQAGDSGVDTK